MLFLGSKLLLDFTLKTKLYCYLWLSKNTNLNIGIFLYKSIIYLCSTKTYITFY